MARSKYNVSKDTSKRTCDGIVFDSIVEMKYYRDIVKPAYENGEIVEYELQKPYELQPKFKKDGKTIRAINYVADFYIKYQDGREQVIDTKGFPDSVAKMKQKMMWYTYPEVDYIWIKYVKKYGGWIEYAEWERRNKEEKKEKANVKKGI